MKRNITNKINFLLDNCVPPILRDNKIFMSILLKCAVGKKYRYYMQFKEKIPMMGDTDIQKYYTILADTFIKRETDLNDESIRYIKNILQSSKNGILDAACGKGYLVKKLHGWAKGTKITALDIVLPDTQRNGIEYVQGTITNLPFEKDSFDVVICTHALEHIKDISLALKELRRVCRKQLIIVIPRQREYKYTFDLHIHFFPYRYNVKRLFGNQNVSIELIGNDWVCQELYELE